MSLPDIKFASKVDPMLSTLPDYVKDPRNFYKIQKALLETMVCHSSHSEPMDVFKCSKCQDNMLERRKLMLEFGFKSPAQYMAWRKSHEAVKKLMPLDMYNRIVDDKS